VACDDRASLIKRNFVRGKLNLSLGPLQSLTCWARRPPETV
jgi:hypothetical protein